MTTKLHKRVASSPSASHWERLGLKKHVGINLPLSALRSAKSSGIGEFLDLLPLIEWCSEVGFSIIQLLPLNDSGADPSPYNTLSSCALHPIYLSLHALPHLKEPDLLEEIEKMDALNAAERVPFETVLTGKMHILSLYLKKHRRLFLTSSAYEDFTNKNPWLRPYALFKALLKENSHAPLSAWPDDLKYPTADSLKKLYETYEEEVLFHMVVQYLCFSQLMEVREHARKYGVKLKGDLPILISPSSADVWHHVEFFNLDLQIGSPPDLYCPEGQNWGFPGINWDVMKRSDFLWWKARLAYADNFYDLYRIDHALGLFRLWSIPKGSPTKNGYFNPADENLWGPHGKELLEMLLSVSSMLPVAEDLGAIPPVTKEVLSELCIPGTKVLRWEKDPDEPENFLNPTTFDPISLSCISTHDSPTLEQWWRDFPKETTPFTLKYNWSYQPKISPLQRKEILRQSIHSGSLLHIDLFSEYLALIPELVDPNPDNERINIPGTVHPFNWSYKFQKPIEYLINHEQLRIKIKQLLS